MATKRIDCILFIAQYSMAITLAIASGAWLGTWIVTPSEFVWVLRAARPASASRYVLVTRCPLSGTISLPSAGQSKTWA